MAFRLEREGGENRRFASMCATNVHRNLAHEANGRDGGHRTTPAGPGPVRRVVWP
jgi:hypothetical protein